MQRQCCDISQLLLFTTGFKNHRQCKPGEVAQSLVCLVCRARTVISDQLTQLATAPNSEVTNALRGDLNQILTSYGNLGTYPSSRNHALSMALGHSSQRSTGFSSRPVPRSSGAGLQSSGYGPYSTRIQSDFADRSISAQGMGRTTNEELTNRDNAPRWARLPNRGLPTRGPDPPWLPGLASQTGPPGLYAPPPGLGPLPTAARAAGNSPTGLSFSEMYQQSKQPLGPGLPRATSDASAAGMSPIATAC